MASLLEEKCDFNVVDKPKTQNPIKTKNIGASIDGIHTDIVINEYQDRIFVILSQYKKFGSLLCVTKENSKADDDIGVYKVRTILGKDDISQDVAVRYLAEQTLMTKPALFSICLKDSSLKTLKAIKGIILDNKTW